MSNLILPCLGLAPDHHPLQAPPGTMRVADNVVCDLPGIIRGRPNFTQNTSKSTTYVPVAMHVFGSTPIMVSKDGSNYRLESAAATISGNAEPVSFDACETSFAESRKSLYYCTSTGVRALRTEAGTATEAAGLDLASAISPRRGVLFAQVTFPTDPGWVAAWAWVVKRTDANGVVRRSPPSQRWVHAENTATTPPTFPITIADSFSGDHFRFGFPTGTLQAGDEVEFYRSVIVTTATGTPSSDLYLAFVYTITAADVAALAFPADSGVTIKDNCTDDQLGEALYTNPQREGILNAKTAPPMAQQVALWGSCMWYGRTKERHRLVVTLLGVGQDSATAAFRPAMTANTIGRHDNTTTAGATGDYLIATNTILNVTDVTGVEVGDYITDGTNGATEAAGTQVPADTTVVSITGGGPYTVTMSKNALATQVGGGVRFYSKVTIDSVDFRAEQFTRLGPNGAGFTSYKAFGTGWNYDNQADRAARSAAELAKAINAAQSGGLVTVRAYTIEDSGQLVIERTTVSGAAFSLTSAKIAAWAPRAGSALTSTQEDRPNRVFFSLPDEPEAVPVLNYFDVGSQLYPIQKLVPMKDALLVFKEDGIYRITGSYPNWSVDCIDEKSRLVRPECVAVLDGVAYAWTNRGVLEVDESGVRSSISNGKIDYAALFTPQAAILGDSAYHGARVLVSERHSLVLLTIPDTSYSSPRLYSDNVYCFAVKTGKWTRWPGLYVRCGAAQTTGRLWICGNNELNEMEWSLQYLTDTPRGYDLTYSGLAWTDTASSVSMSISSAQRGEWVPKAGDWVWWTIGSVYWRRILTASANGSGGYDITLDSAAPSNIASATVRGAVVGTPVVMEWMPSAMNTGGISLGVWRELTFQVMGEAQAKVSPTDFRVTVGVRHDGSATIATVTGTPDRSVVLLRPYRMGWPRAAARRPIAFTRLSWSEIDWPWMLGGIALIGESGSEKVRQ